MTTIYTHNYQTRTTSIVGQTVKAPRQGAKKQVVSVKLTNGKTVSVYKANGYWWTV